MTNCNISTDEKTGEIVIRINPDEQHGTSSSGKSVIVASTHGAVKMADGLAISLNAYRSK